MDQQTTEVYVTPAQLIRSREAVVLATLSDNINIEAYHLLWQP